MLLQRLSDRHDHASFRETHEWSIENPGDFWREAWSDLGIAGDPGSTAMTGQGFSDTRWFPEGSLNVVNTLLAGNPDDEVLVALRRCQYWTSAIQ